MIRAFVTARIDDPFESLDLAQEVFLIAFRRAVCALFLRFSTSRWA